MYKPPIPVRLRIVLTCGGDREVVAYAYSGKQALHEAINLLCMQTELKSGYKLTVIDDKLDRLFRP